MAMPIKARCGRADEIPPGSSKVVQIREHMVAIFNVAGTLHAIDKPARIRAGRSAKGTSRTTRSCPARARLDLQPAHRSVADRAEMKVACYPVRVEAGHIIVELP